MVTRFDNGSCNHVWIGMVLGVEELCDIIRPRLSIKSRVRSADHLAVPGGCVPNL
jgi:hypothetical protein